MKKLIIVFILASVCTVGSLSFAHAWSVNENPMEMYATSSIIKSESAEDAKKDEKKKKQVTASSCCQVESKQAACCEKPQTSCPAVNNACPVAKKASKKQ